jgi:glycerol kinase
MNLYNKNIIATGVWQSRDQLRVLQQVDKVFDPRAHVCEEYDTTFTLWSQALDRFLNWYDRY